MAKQLPKAQEENTGEWLNTYADMVTLLLTFFVLLFACSNMDETKIQYIMQAFQIWNDYLLASLYVSKKGLKTLTVAIQSLFSAQASDYTTAMAAIVVSVLPISILFLSLQKYFIKGMTVGAVKG